MSESSPQARPARRMIFAMLGLSAASIVGSIVAVIVLAQGGVAQVEAVTTLDAQGRVAVRFSNRGTREGFLCGWVSVACPGSAKQTVHLCADDVAPTEQTTVTTRLRVGDRAGCQVSFLPNDMVSP